MARILPSKKLSREIKTAAAKLKKMRTKLRELKEKAKAEVLALSKKPAAKKKRGRKPKK